MQAGNEFMLCQLEAQVLEPTSVTLFCLNCLLRQPLTYNNNNNSNNNNNNNNKTLINTPKKGFSVPIYKYKCKLYLTS